jgi:hypothetical protein
MTPWGDALFELADAALCGPGSRHENPHVNPLNQS